jgi:hypothetical protein
VLEEGAVAACEFLFASAGFVAPGVTAGSADTSQGVDDWGRRVVVSLHADVIAISNRPRK